MREKNEMIPAVNKEHGGAFDRYVEASNQFINQVAAELGISNKRTALRITKAVLHSIRDRIEPNDALEFGQGLPLLMKAVYFDQYNISATPVRIRSKYEFLDFVRSKESLAGFDFLSDDDVMDALQAVLYVLKHHMDYGQVEQLMEMLPMDLRDLFRTDLRQGILSRRNAEK